MVKFTAEIEAATMYDFQVALDKLKNEGLPYCMRYGLTEIEEQDNQLFRYKIRINNEQGTITKSCRRST